MEINWLLVFRKLLLTIFQQNAIVQFPPSLTKTVMVAPENYENTRDIPKGLFVDLSVP